MTKDEDLARVLQREEVPPVLAEARSQKSKPKVAEFSECLLHLFIETVYLSAPDHYLL